ncbi:MAG: hypothetical protein D6710_10595 [Nitrospirae bacterium]|nr:MAG: hypothetical protein D6710_10595 [Nitrospirota bacterium]
MRGEITKNPGLKIISFILALLLWYNISQKGMTEISRDISVEYINIPAGIEILDKDVDRVSLSVYGSEQIIKTLKQGDIRVVINLEDSEPGKRTFKIGKDNIRLPSALTVTDINPDTITLVLDRIIKRTLPVRVRFSGAFDRKKYRVRTKPAFVDVEGPSTIVSKLNFLSTEPLKLPDIMPQEGIRVPISNNYKRLKLSVEEVTVIIRPKGENRAEKQKEER